jgi:hypothetical protein
MQQSDLMAELSCESVERYLRKLKGREVRVLRLVPLREDEEPKAIKFWGYGSPVRIGGYSRESRR